MEDLDGLVRRCREAGVEVIADTPLEGRRRVYAHDPFGNRVELIEARQS